MKIKSQKEMKPNKKLSNLFFYDSPLKIITNIQELDFTLKLSKRADITYAHIRNLLKEMEELKIIEMKINPECRRANLIILTNTGKELQKKILDIIRILGENENKKEGENNVNRTKRIL